MVLLTLRHLLRQIPKVHIRRFGNSTTCLATTTASGQILPKPPITRFGLFGLVCAVIPGLLVGATISKRIANFLEENELFIPSDDDDDDDD